MQIREYSIISHSLLIALYVYCNSYAYLLMMAAPVLHLLVIKNDSACYRDHCHTQIHRRFKEERLCLVCELDEWIRMRHCRKCNQCIHKYDHHCVLMGICIGEFNHKYYVLFLYSYLLNTVILMYNFHSSIVHEVLLDEFGVEHLSGKYYLYAIGLIILYFNTFLASYLTINHTMFMVNNQTTWESVKRDSIPYLKHVPASVKYPFSQGCTANIKRFFSTDANDPIEWEILQR